MPVLAGTHQGGGALVVLEVHVSAAAKEQLHHGNTAVAHCQHERCLARLRKGEWEVERIRMKLLEGRWKRMKTDKVMHASNIWDLRPKAKVRRLSDLDYLAGARVDIAQL